MFKKFLRKCTPNPLHRLLRKSGSVRSFLIGWNRGLGDIPLGIFPLVYKIRKRIPEAEITVCTRHDLAAGFSLLPSVKTIIEPRLIRGKPYDIKKFVDETNYDVVINWPDPTFWCRDLLGKITPRLQWNSDWNGAWKRLDLDPNLRYIVIQPSAHTTHGPWRSWTPENYNKLIAACTKWGQQVVLVGSKKEAETPIQGGIDLRGKTTIAELFSLIKERSFLAILPDSGILSILYYIEDAFPLQVISLWSKPLQGVLKQGVFSPNPLLSHLPLIGGYKDVSSISLDQVLDAVKSSVTSITSFTGKKDPVN